MSTDIALIRSYIQDKPIFIKETAAIAEIMQVKHFPVMQDATHDVYITDAEITAEGGVPDFEVDPEQGVLTFESEPGSGSITLNYYTVLLSDQTIQDIIDLGDNSGELRLAAADCLDAMASNMALLLRKIKSMDLETDGPALAKALREHAVAIRDQVGTEPSLEVIEMINDRPGYTEKILKEFLRTEV